VKETKDPNTTHYATQWGRERIPLYGDLSEEKRKPSASITGAV
jgi:hypothetical protein